MASTRGNRNAGERQWSDTAARAQDWRAVLPLGTLILSLLVLIVVAVSVRQRTQELRNEIEADIQPMRPLVTTVEVALALEMAALRGFLITGDDDYLRQYREANADHVAALDRIRPMAVAVGRDVLEAYTELRTLSRRWHLRIERADALRMPPAAPPAEATLEDELFDEALAAAVRLEQEIAAAIAERRARIRDISRVDYRLSIVLGLLALAAAAVLARLGIMLRRRAREETALRKVARDVTAAADLENVARRIAAGATRVVDATGAYVEHILPPGDVVEVSAAAGRGAPAVSTRVPFPGSLTDAVLRSGEAEVITGTRRDDRPMFRHLVESCGDCSLLVVPLISGGEPLGALVVIRDRNTDRFTGDDVARARILGDLAALALRRILALEDADRRRRELERVMATRTRLIRGISHDLKNPLGAADGYAQLLEAGMRGELPPQQREWVSRIRRTIGSAIDTINELLELSRAETGRLRIERAPHDVRPVVIEAAEDHAGAAAAAGIRVQREMPQRLPVVRTDPARVRQILDNLLSNAVKYTQPGGSITVRAELRDAGNAPGPGTWLAIDVSDTGPGIPEQEQEHIFEEFYRAEHGGAVERGAGLGLAISRRIARLLGGDITVVSRPEEGSTFTLWLPLAEPAPAARGEAA